MFICLQNEFWICKYDELNNAMQLLTFHYSHVVNCTKPKRKVLTLYVYHYTEKKIRI